MSKNNYIIILILLFLSSCNIGGENIECEKKYSLFLKAYNGMNNKMAIIHINEAIKCDSINQNYRFEKMKFLLRLGRYREVNEELKSLSVLNNDYSLYPLSALIDIKLGDEAKGREKMNNLYDKLKKENFNKENFNIFYYYIASDFFVNGKESTINKIKQKDSIYVEIHERNVLEYMLELLNTDRDRIDILNEMFGIN